MNLELKEGVRARVIALRVVNIKLEFKMMGMDEID